MSTKFYSILKSLGEPLPEIEMLSFTEAEKMFQLLCDDVVRRYRAGPWTYAAEVYDVGKEDR